MNTRSLKSRSLLLVGFVLAGLILVNIISVRLFGRIDLTSKDLFTLSDASKQLVGSLDDKIAVTAYFTEDLPPPYNNYRRAVLDQLNEYKAYSNGNLVYEFISPDTEEGEQDAQQQGIAPVQVQVVEEDKFEAKRAYMGLAFYYEDKKEVMPVVQNLSSLEYDISATIKRLTTTSKRKIGFLSGHGEPGLQELQGVQHTLAGQYELATVDVSEGKAVPPDVAALIVMAPSSPIPETHQYQIDQYLMRGGKVAFLLNRVQASLQERFGREFDTGMDEMLAAYGLRVNVDLVRDARCANISIVQQTFGFNVQSQVPFPLLPLAGDFNRENMIVKDLKAMVLFFTSSVDTLDLGAKGLKGELLITSSKQSGRMTRIFMINPLSDYSPAEFSEQYIPLAWLVTGQFTSAYASREIPVDSTTMGIAPDGEKLLKSPESRIVLVGDGDFARDAYLGNSDNVNFLANLIDYLVDDAGLITIRSKDVTPPPLEQVEDGTKNLLKYGSLLVPPLIVLGYGLVRWRTRQARRRALEAA
jgi:gliding-associated putative ABC transporter substrate-binding component GldG